MKPNSLSLYVQSKAPTSKFSIWKSEHTQGADHIFISRKHELYEESKVGLREDGETAEAVAFICSVSRGLDTSLLHPYLALGIGENGASYPASYYTHLLSSE